MSSLLWNWLKRRSGSRAAKELPVAGQAGGAGGAQGLIDAGISAEAAGDPRGAERLFREAVAVAPGSAFAHLNLGIALQARQAFEAAIESHTRAIGLDPVLFSAHHNLALALLSLGRSEEAERAFRETLRLKPGFPEAWVGLAEALESLGRDDKALEALRTAIGGREHYVGALFNAAVLLRRLGRLDEAEALLRDVPRDHPEYANAMTALAASLRDQGRIEEAVEVLRSALRESPTSWNTQSELLFTLGFSDRVGAEALFAEHFMAGCRIESVTPPWCAGFSNAPEPGRILNIGYLSGDFRLHSVAWFTEYLFSRHRRDQVRVHAYSSTMNHDPMTAQIAAAADVWRDCRLQPDAVVAATILGDRIDLLIDLAGHTSGSRIRVLAGRSAPVQMTWLGYINTTGLTRVDYRITDSIADPAGDSEALHTERLIRMPHSQWCFHPPEAARAVPAERDPSLGSFTFGVLNQFAKVSESSIALWIAVLRAIPGSRLRVVGVPAGAATERVVRLLVGSGVGRARFDLVERLALADYYRQYGLVDACLDTTPYSGGTTTCDALYLGVPVVTLAGSRPISRSSASLLSTVGRADLVAKDAGAFVSIAMSLAAGGPWVNESRSALRRKMIASPLMDEEGFTHDLEDLYRRAWREWCATQRSN